jgi:DinB superfamily
MKKRKNATAKDPHGKQLREHLLALLEGGGAHANFNDAVKDMPEEARGLKSNGLPHTAWMLLEHLRSAQWDILEFSRNSKHESPKWPEGYWPKTEAPSSAAAWNKSIQQFRKDLKTMQDLVANPKTDLYARIPWGDGQTILREVLLVADHNAYHVAQLIDVRRLLGAWNKS